MTFNSEGILNFDPIPITGKAEKMFKPFWAIINTNDDLDDYYRWLLLRRFNIILQAPAWGPHITVADGQPPLIKGTWEKIKQEYDQKVIPFTYQNTPLSNGRHWWLRVQCPIITEIREKLNVQRTNLKWGLHLTLGMPIPRHEEHSMYIHRIETTM